MKRNYYLMCILSDWNLWKRSSVIEYLSYWNLSCVKMKREIVMYYSVLPEEWPSEVSICLLLLLWWNERSLWGILRREKAWLCILIDILKAIVIILYYYIIVLLLLEEKWLQRRESIGGVLKRREKSLYSTMNRYDMCLLYSNQCIGKWKWLWRREEKIYSILNWMVCILFLDDDWKTIIQ